MASNLGLSDWFMHEWSGNEQAGSVMKRHWLVLTVVALSLGLMACPPKPEGGTSSSTGEGEILVGEFGSLTGPQATFGQSTHNGIMMAVDEINVAGGVNGRKIKVLTEDDQSKQEEAANAVTKLISQNSVVALLGEVASSASIAAAPIAQSSKVPMITPASTNPAVTQKGDYIFRMCFVDTYQGENLAVFAANHLKVKRVAILVDVKSDYSTGLAQFFEQRFRALGGTVVEKVSYSNGDADFRSQLTAVKSSNPQLLFVPGYYTDIGQIASQARDLGITQPMLGGDGWESPKLFEIGGKALEGCYYSTHYFADDPAPVVRDFVQKYKGRFQATPDAMSALAYDAARVLADSMRRAGKMEGTAIRDAIAATRDFSGVTGMITMGPDRNPVGKKLVIVKIEGGQLKLATTIDPATEGQPVAAGTTATTAAQ